MSDVTVAIDPEATSNYSPNLVFAGGTMTLRQQPCDGGAIDVGSGIHETAHHEAVHRLEDMNGDFGSPNADLPGYKDRNADYVTAVKGELAAMKALEERAKKGATAAQMQQTWNEIQRRFMRGALSENPKWPVPNLDQLQQWTGFRARIDEIREVYLSGCAGEEMRKVVLASGEPVAPPEISGFIPPTGLTVGTPADQPPDGDTQSPPPPATDNPPEDGAPIGF